MPTRRGLFGRWGESQACAFLKRQGFQVVERNFQTLAGEIDIIARRGDDYYFVEVKTRAAGPLATDLAVTVSKRRKLGKVAGAYCHRRDVSDVGIIFASLLVTVYRPNRLTFRLAPFPASFY